ncbi:hypothetical protein MB84_27475 (plasmid) [Pandoraea oxalativorans]|uniref:HTH merR-type domain-containing protein n=2 Tax=Pandoraea oxalativorans TaxID=573737 RepID=A0A0G3IF97_9BURK|nr:hypothetical protein MB84_27475 [Pandoraea oxalativorans]
MKRAGPIPVWLLFIVQPPQGGHMKQDGEIRLLLEERRKGTSQKLAAARTGMSERTVRKYERAGKLPSQMKAPTTHRTRTNPFLTDWPWVQAQLQRDPALQAKTELLSNLVYGVLWEI